MADDKKPDDKKPDDRKKPERSALEPDAAGNVRVEAIMGPYRGQHLTMTAADGQAAIDAHWARNASDAHYEHDALSEQERQAAWDASHAWAKAQQDAAQNPPETEPPPPEGGARKRSMAADEPAGYATRQTPPAEPKKK